MARYKSSAGEISHGRVSKFDDDNAIIIPPWEGQKKDKLKHPPDDSYSLTCHRQDDPVEHRHGDQCSPSALTKSSENYGDDSRTVVTTKKMILVNQGSNNSEYDTESYTGVKNSDIKVQAEVTRGEWTWITVTTHLDIVLLLIFAQFKQR